MANTTDKNGLILSSQSDSGYKFVTTLFDGPLVGKFIAFADVVGDERQYQNSQRGRGRVKGFFGHKNVLALGVFDDVRDAAFIGQAFYGEDNAHRNNNVDMLLEGNEAVLPKLPRKKWEHEADKDSMDRGKKRHGNRATIVVQEALAEFYKNNKDDYTVTAEDAVAIRSTMNEYLDAIKKPKNSDIRDAAKIGFEPFRK